ncbi:AMP-dependent synthetase/ligase [Trueperella sp. LYQ143]|uniref:AMP-dependent synthetase/ligase n=1 Tax=unclassified Trueperella TaxID=2630174 RepID=UPI0039836D69
MESYLDTVGVSYIPAKLAITDDMTVPSLMCQRANEQPHNVCIERKSTLGETWRPVTWSEFYSEVCAVARGFIAHGLQPGDCVAIMSHTSYEWSLFDLAVQCAGGVAVPIYETSSSEQARWIIEDSAARFAVVETQAMALVMHSIRESGLLEKVFVLAEDAQGHLVSAGSSVPDDEIERRINALTADDLFTIIYTSGTTGRPKGVEITHRNMLHSALNAPLDEGLHELLGSKGSRTLLFLPMAHVFARFLNLAILFAEYPRVGYCPDTKNLISDMQSFKPTFILAVPRLFEKIYNAADANARRGLKLRMFRTAARAAIEYARTIQRGEKPSALVRARQEFFDRTVYSKLRAIMGGKVRYAISGGAPLGERLGSFFYGAGIPILEGYGATETCAPTTVNRTHALRIGSVGPAYPGCYVTSGEDGELLVKGPHVFRGYRNNPEATAESFTDDGWFRTGDIGNVDEAGFVWVTGRKKEIIVTAGGKNVAPAQLEDRLRSHPIISQVVVLGDQKPFIAALVTLDAEALPQWLSNRGLPPMSISDAVRDPQVIAAIDRAVKRTNEHVSRAESIRKFTILPIDFTTDNGYLTPSMKVIRSAVLRDFADDIERLYSA